MRYISLRQVLELHRRVGIFYVTGPDLTTVLAVFRGHRDPKVWKSRS
jgi:hypothetical protein